MTINKTKEKNKQSIKAKEKAVVIIGPTSSGKTALAVKLALDFEAEVISADSRQVYKGMDVGTGKDLSEYSIKTKTGIKKITYHLIDVCSPKDNFNLSKYLKLANKALDDISERGKLPLIVGGTGLYAQALVDNYQISKVKENKELRDKLEEEDLGSVQALFKKEYLDFYNKLNNSDKNNKRRLIRYLEILKDKGALDKKSSHPKFEFLVLKIEVDRKELKQRIRDRIIKRIEEEDMIAEVEKLHKEGLSWKKLESFGLEYKFISKYLQNKLSYKEMIEDLYITSCRFAKRQSSWFRRWEKQGREIYEIKDFKEAKEKINNFLKK
ncbi:tRNA (adenosine(37)-N6)-dimethylallyltransferase MiaA [Patescibacteria group bacterium]|nr:tRNA (adenosine(37)-N6)-dimethylallyltransferase MiaA [Patescibacteria group bacterium]